MRRPLLVLLLATTVGAFSPVHPVDLFHHSSSSKTQVQSKRLVEETLKTLPNLFTNAAPVGVTSLTSTVALSKLVTSNADPHLEAQVLTDVSHLGLDLATFLGPGVLAIRLLAVVGRLCSMAADYLPDHTMLPEEVIFQSFMLSVALYSLGQASLVPWLANTVHNVTKRDSTVYRKLFEDAGMTWTSYKAMANYALHWMEVDANRTLNNDQYVYWLYDGHVTVQNHDNSEVSHTIVARPDQPFSGLVGEQRLVHGKTVSIRTDTPCKLLCMDVSKMETLMKNSNNFGESMKTLLFQGMEAKLTLQQQQKTTLPQSNSTA